jgi:hypothetical protein
LSQRELATQAGLDEGFTSRIVRQLEAQRLVERESNGAVRVADFDALLKAWREVYDFFRHHIIRGNIAARSSNDVLRRVAAKLKQNQVEHAATGLAGAWLLDHFVGFRLVTIYTERLPNAEVQEAMGFREETRGENVWLVVPNDAGVFRGAAERDGVRCAHPVQLYMDLKNHPERSAEAAEELRHRLFREASHA